MVYVNANGVVEPSRSMWRFSIITDFLWAILNFLYLFVDTLINPKKPIPNRSRDFQSFGGNSNGSGNNQGGGGEGGYGGRPRPVFPKGGNIRQLPKACATGG